MDEKELAEWFAANKTLLETAYLASEDPWQQSGSSIGRKRTGEHWVAQRRCTAECLDRSGSFLDVGCANGYLLERMLQWTRERGLEIIPYGLDFSEGLVALARQRLPQYADHIYVGNAWDWMPRILLIMYAPVLSMFRRNFSPNWSAECSITLSRRVAPCWSLNIGPERIRRRRR